MSTAEAIEPGEPYPGLRAFRRDETHIFFGREGTISEMVDRLAAHRFLAVTGHSGSGKSSLVRTGLIDALDRGLLVEAGSNWCVADFRPGGQPFSRLTGALVKAVGRPYSDQELGLIEAKLTGGPLGLLGWLDEINFPAETNVLLLVDQFEEIFRYRQGQSGDDVDAFVALLLASAKHGKQRGRRVYVVITMRSDFLGDCARFTDLAETINDGQFLTPRLTRDQCREAIEGPAVVYDGRVEPALVTRMLNDMGGNPDQLPLMQHILMLLWQEARARAGSGVPELTLADYKRLGGIGTAGPEADAFVAAKRPSLFRRLFGCLRKTRPAEAKRDEAISVNGALSDHADKVLASLTPEQQRLAEKLFRALTEGEGTGGRDVRRPVTLADAAAITDSLINDLVPIIETFRAPGCNFLTPPFPDPLRPEDRIDISHESLIRQWVKLRRWVREEYQSAETYRDIERSAKQWENRRGNLLAKLDLAVARAWRKSERPNGAWAARYGGAFNLAMAFLRKSERHRLWRRAIVAASTSAVVLVVLSTTLISLILMGVMGSRSYDNPAEERSDFGIEAQSTLKSDVGTNTPLAIPGGRVIKTKELESALGSGTLDGVPFLAIDAWRRSVSDIVYVPKSIYIAYAGDYGTFNDATQAKLRDELSKLSNGTLDMPLVFFCIGSKCWESYNAALRAINLGYTRVYWYRGGITAWREAQRPYPITFSLVRFKDVPRSLNTIWTAVRDEFWPDPVYYYNSGASYAANKQYDNAVEDFTRAISINPRYAEAYLQRGRAYLSKEDYSLAMVDLAKAAELDPQKKAEVDAILRDPKIANGYVVRGRAFYDKKKYDSAIEEFDKAVAIAPENAAAYYNRGRAYYAKENYPKAIEDLGQVIKIDPKNTQAFNMRGNAYYGATDYTNAIESYGQAIALSPRDKVLRANRGGAYKKKNDCDHAIPDYDAAIAIDPKYGDAYQSRGQCYAEKEDYEKAISDLTQAIAANPNNVDLIVERAAMYLSKRDYHHAIQETTEALSRRTADVFALWVRARAKLYSEGADQAVNDLLAAVKAQPNGSTLVMWLHVARLRSGQDDAEELAANAKGFDRTRWPWPIIGLFLGAGAPEAVMSTAQSGNAAVRQDWMCQAAFFVGIHQAAKGAQDAARALFQDAAKTCSKASPEYHAAKEELSRLY
jgi:PQQ-dependent catabolism-associated CXXCW motif protein